MSRGVAAAAVGAAIAATAATGGTQVVPVVGAPRPYEVADPGGPGLRRPPPPERRSWAFLVALARAARRARRPAGPPGPDPRRRRGRRPPTVDPGRRAPASWACPSTEARATLEQAGFEVSEVAEEVADPTQVGIVIDQNPDGGIRVDEGSTVEIDRRLAEHLRHAQPRRFHPRRRPQHPPRPRLHRRDPRDRGGERRPSKPARSSAPSRPPASRWRPPPPSPWSSRSGPPHVPVPSCATLTESDCVAARHRRRLHPRGGAGRRRRRYPRAGSSAPSRRAAPRPRTARRCASSCRRARAPPPCHRSRASARPPPSTPSRTPGSTRRCRSSRSEPGSADDGVVIAQNPGGNTQAPPGSTVSIVVGQADVGD